MLTAMLMIAAALEEELETAKSLCIDITKVEHAKTRLWQGVRNSAALSFVRTGIGPKRSALRLQEALITAKPSQILVIGYAGALDPELKLGDVVAIEKVLLLSENPPGWEQVQVEGEFNLERCSGFQQAATAAGISSHVGIALTSYHVLGHPIHKRLLHQRFQAATVDMETAALARVAQAERIPLRCIRVVSDEAEDAFLVPFSYDPATGIPVRAKHFVETGVLETYRRWKSNSSIAKARLSNFLSQYL
jgi:adenosylhomocysteine nucleosidase